MSGSVKVLHAKLRSVEPLHEWKDGLFALAREDVRLQMLKDAWWKRPNQMKVEQFKNQNPLWSKVLRLWPSKTYNSYKRCVLHKWADKHNIGCQTHYPA